ncbi:hypothetical protein BG011_000230, partial [Mortierella polycephala]
MVMVLPVDLAETASIAASVAGEEHTLTCKEQLTPVSCRFNKVGVMTDLLPAPSSTPLQKLNSNISNTIINSNNILSNHSNKTRPRSKSEHVMEAVPSKATIATVSSALAASASTDTASKSASTGKDRRRSNNSNSNNNNNNNTNQSSGKTKGPKNTGSKLRPPAHASQYLPPTARSPLSITTRYQDQHHSLYEQRISLHTEESDSDSLSTVSQSSAQYSSSASIAPIRRGRVFRKLTRHPDSTDSEDALSMSPLESSLVSRNHSPSSSRASSLTRSRPSSPLPHPTIPQQQQQRDSLEDESTAGQQSIRSRIPTPITARRPTEQAPSTLRMSMEAPLTKPKRKRRTRRKIQWSNKLSGDEGEDEDEGGILSMDLMDDNIDPSTGQFHTPTTSTDNNNNRVRNDSSYSSCNSSCTSPPPPNDIHGMRNSMDSQSQDFSSLDKEVLDVLKGLNSAPLPYHPSLQANEDATEELQERTLAKEMLDARKQAQNGPSMASNMAAKSQRSFAPASRIQLVSETRHSSLAAFFASSGPTEMLIDPSTDSTLLMSPPLSATLGSLENQMAARPKSYPQGVQPGLPVHHKGPTENLLPPTPEISPELHPTARKARPSSMDSSSLRLMLQPLQKTSNFKFSPSGPSSNSPPPAKPSNTPNNRAGAPPPPPPPPPPAPTSLMAKKDAHGSRSPLHISTTNVSSDPHQKSPAPLTPNRSIVARHVLRWDALSHGDISHTVFDPDLHHHVHHQHHPHHHQYLHPSFRRRRSEGHGPDHHQTLDSDASPSSPDFPVSMESFGAQEAEMNGPHHNVVSAQVAYTSQEDITQHDAVDSDLDQRAVSEASHLGQPEGPSHAVPGALEGPAEGPHEPMESGPIGPPPAIEMDFQKFEELFCIDPIEEQRRVKAKEASLQAKSKPKDVQLLDVRRATNVSIGLSRLMKRYESFEALRSMVLTLDISTASAPPTSEASAQDHAMVIASPIPKSPLLHAMSFLDGIGNVDDEVKDQRDTADEDPDSMFCTPSRPSRVRVPSKLALLFSAPSPSGPPSPMGALGAHPLFASLSRPSSPAFSSPGMNHSSGSLFASRSDSPAVYQQHLNLDDLLTLEPLLPSDKERSVLEVYRRQHKAEFMANETEAVQKLGLSERFMYAMSKPVFTPLPESMRPNESSLQWAGANSALLKGGFASLNLKRIRSATPMLSSLATSSTTTQDEDPILIDDYLFASICMLRFDSDVKATEAQIKELTEGCDGLRMNENLKVLFLGVLQVGNMLNTIYGRKKPSWQQQYYHQPQIAQ